MMLCNLKIVHIFHVTSPYHRNYFMIVCSGNHLLKFRPAIETRFAHTGINHILRPAGANRYLATTKMSILNQFINGNITPSASCIKSSALGIRLGNRLANRRTALICPKFFLVVISNMFRAQNYFKVIRIIIEMIAVFMMKNITIFYNASNCSMGVLPTKRIWTHRLGDLLVIVHKALIGTYYSTI